MHGDCHETQSRLTQSQNGSPSRSLRSLFCTCAHEWALCTEALRRPQFQIEWLDATPNAEMRIRETRLTGWFRIQSLRNLWCFEGEPFDPFLQSLKAIGSRHDLIRKLDYM